MSFFTSLTGINAATAQMSVTSNNIANAGTVGFKKSRTDFGDIFATSPLQKASTTIGQGVSLKQVSLAFSQGNVSFSSNTLDMAISGDGFFPLKSPDGFQDIYTRNGTFMMNDQNNVVNSSGQRLMAAKVDSSGKADVSNMSVLTIPQKTTGQAKQTTQVTLGLNFPADAPVITAPFNRNDSTTYNKSTALTVYDKGGNGYLATVYYQKTQNASQASPNNRWQTYVYVGDTLVNAALQQATDTATGEPLFVNKYGQLKPLSQVSDLLVNQKTQKFALTDLTDVRTSAPASVSGGLAPNLTTLSSDGIDFGGTFTGAAAGTIPPDPASVDNLKNLFSISIDGSPAKSISLDYLAKLPSGTRLSGAQIAQEIQNNINRQFGNERLFNFNSNANKNLVITAQGPAANGVIPPSTNYTLILDGTAGNPPPLAAPGQMTIEQTTKSINDQLAALQTNITAVYDSALQTFTFTPAVGTTLAVNTPNALMGVTTTIKQDPNATALTLTAYPQGDLITPVKDQRFGATVSYDSVNQKFVFASGTTGDSSSIKIITKSSDLGNTFARNKLGLIESDPNGNSIGTVDAPTQANNNVKTVTYSVDKSDIAVRGTQSTPAVMTGSAIGINLNQNFEVNASNNKFVVSVDDVKGTVVIPPLPNYTLDSFVQALQDGINRLKGPPALNGLTGSTVSGVKVSYDPLKNALSFTSGTASTNSFIKVSGDAVWGLSNVTAARGSTSSWIKPTQSTVTSSGTPVSQYIDAFGKETSSATGFSTLPAWSPIYLNKGELTFDTGGNLVSPKGGAKLDTVFLPNGKGSLTINIDYTKSTQFSSPYAVLSQSQDGAPEGDLVGVAVGTDGLVQCSYSNGSQNSLGKVVLVNFANPAGLRQIGDASFYASSSSGVAKLGEAGSAGYGTVKSGATENANVDLTQELVDLITEQRNFQANAKAIETDTTLTQTIIQIRA
jgi:flagellar hook-basal body protein